MVPSCFSFISSFVTCFRVLGFFVLTCSCLFAQTKPADLVAQYKETHSFQRVSLFQKSTVSEIEAMLPPSLQTFEIFDLETQAVERLTASTSKTISLNLDFNDEKLELELVAVDLFPNGFNVKEMPSGKLLSSEAKGKHYRGILKGVEGSIVSLSIVNGEVFSFISAPKLGNLVLGKMKTQDAYVLYNDQDIADEFSYLCSANSDKTSIEQAASLTERSEAQCAGIWLDVGHDIVLDKGGVAEACAYIEALFAQVAVLYANEEINLFISGMQVWSEQEPFADLSAYKKFQSDRDWSGSLAHYINYAHGGGLAWVDALCSKENGYGVSGIQSTFGEAPTYSWSTYVIAHELGHGFGSAHTHDCVWNGNNTPIDVCGSTTCDGEIPAEGGTIMSYCYVTAVGVNFSLGFGEQPGNLIRNRLAVSECGLVCSPLDEQTLSAGTVSALPDVDVLVFPNPATERLQIQLSSFKNQKIALYLVDYRGHIVYTNLMQDALKGTIEVSNFPRGVYFLNLKHENGTQVIQKIVLQ